jgi:hypothetical protein
MKSGMVLFNIMGVMRNAIENIIVFQVVKIF